MGHTLKKSLSTKLALLVFQLFHSHLDHNDFCTTLKPIVA
jgi:hypothetical protein